MKDSRVLSSVQALDDYFDALLEDDDQQRTHTDVKSDIADVAELTLQPAKAEAIPLFSGATLTKQQRDLSSVERLLSQLQLEEGLEVEVEEVVDVDLETEVDALTEVVTEAEVETETETEASVDVDLDLETHVDTVSDIEVLEQTQVTEDVVVDMQTYAEAAATEEAIAEVTDAEPQVDLAVDDFVIEQVEAPASEDFYVEDTAYVEPEVETDVEPEVQADEDIAPPWQNIASEYAFQVLFFESFGVTYAVPLAELGGIHRLEDCNHLIGRPDWYLGLQTERDQQLDVVDTAKWVMPEKITDNSHREGYSYIVLLGDSKWGLACNSLLGTESLKGEQVRWREQAGKRPWLAGLVKERMCALIHVKALIAMLNQGIDANALA
ncbi:chemotaxis protein CheW [Enterovibrio calviensis]|uniref:chemotaxis protein CheW n=1 Tax=Enterovibrio calviensis TaxID=91359 RepID=UPI0004878764|nr:chemotaxis protein CheW [Enterovibrio calviensis]